MFPSLPTPGSMAPPVTIRAGTFMRPAAISIPGVTLSQLETPTHPSSAWPSTMTSQQSDMTSLEMREYLIPLWPMAMPSQTAGTPKTNGFPPASMMPSLTASTISLRWMCPGTMSFQELAIPMNGFSKSSSSRPSARSRLLAGALSRPFLTASLLMVITSFEWFGIMGTYVKFAHIRNVTVDRTMRCGSVR